MQWKMPPLEKIYEAWSAVADGRVKLHEGGAKVMSSDFSREYTVIWKNDVYYSNDNASYWQGYFGYPVIAALMLRGLVPFDTETAELFRGIEWKKLNAAHKRNYSAAASEVFETLEKKGADLNKIRTQAEHVYGVLGKLTLERSRSPLK